LAEQAMAQENFAAIGGMKIGHFSLSTATGCCGWQSRHQTTRRYFPKDDRVNMLWKFEPSPLLLWMLHGQSDGNAWLDPARSGEIAQVCSGERARPTAQF